MADLLTDSEFEKFRKLIYDESGITFSDTNRSVLDSRIKERLREEKLNTVEEYYARILADKEELKLMLDSVTTNLTRFFRNQPHFDALVNYVIPKLLEVKKNSLDKTIRIWSAGCSTGEEPYTIAMILKDILPAPYDFSITASDISLKSLMVGRQGFYTASRIVGIPEKYLDRFFTKSDTGYQVKKELMDKIRFDYHNLRNDSGSRNLDIVFCRNVLIYFDEPAQLSVINRFWNSMSNKSYLFIGHSESLFGMDTKFEFLKTDWACLYQKNL
ncbi:MAG: protein-glutamate O-methyltransferase CheR [Treponema sp.]|nr:protein-glutamate O-methyltransferase CheR [Spirochaetia bacterium]MDD6295118.1 protein-glutamate O-methyltransferase CheR [Treponema sp.]MDD7452141.1 protein-glutamate O-methyltransferase CheR [Treponema sp.]MDY2924593.1 protein-glutamate O-methyltransferase CheR [Treponema sp.]MDY5683849.1 protein-glutamate O-methyltransferase CheR [Treponema sp.]